MEDREQAFDHLEVFGKGLCIGDRVRVGDLIAGLQGNLELADLDLVPAGNVPAAKANVVRRVRRGEIDVFWGATPVLFGFLAVFDTFLSPLVVVGNVRLRNTCPKRFQKVVCHRQPFEELGILHDVVRAGDNAMVSGILRIGIERHIDVGVVAKP